MGRSVVDWASVLADLRARGLSVGGVAARLGVGRSTARGWADGAYPKHHDGEALIALWAKCTGRALSEAPLRPLMPSVAQVLAQHR
jgi:hypothetical protein